MKTNTKAPFDLRKRFRPIPNNREEAVKRIIWGLNDIALNKNDDKELAKLTDIANQKEFEDPYYEMMRYTFWLGVRAVTQIIKNEPSGWNLFAKAISYSFWGHLNDQYARLSEGATYGDPMGAGDESLFYWCIAVARCPDEIARPWGHFFYNMCSRKGILNDVGDEDVFNLFWLLLKCYCENRWIQHDDLVTELGDILPLLEAIGTPEWNRALIDYCDLRLCRAFQFENTCSLKAEDRAFFYYRQWHAIFPLELLALKTIYEAQTGGRLSLEADHPLLHTSLMNPPAFDRLSEDELLEKLNIRSAQHYGDSWQPYKLIPLELRM